MTSLYNSLRVMFWLLGNYCWHPYNKILSAAQFRLIQLISRNYKSMGVLFSRQLRIFSLPVPLCVNLMILNQGPKKLLIPVAAGWVSQKAEVAAKR